MAAAINRAFALKGQASPPLFTAPGADPYPLSPRVETLRRTVAKFGPLAPSPSPPATARAGGAQPERKAPIGVTAGEVMACQPDAGAKLDARC